MNCKDHIMFRDPKGLGITHLRCILQAYAIYNPSIGYCQGMGMIAGMLLMRIPPEVFILLNYIMNRIHFGYLFML